VKTDPDSIYIDGMEGSTGAGPHLATEETGVPGMAAIRQARRAIDDLGKRGEITLIYAGGIRNGGDVAKALALGADAIAIGHSAMMALNCNKAIPEADFESEIGVPAGYCYHCHTGRCPVGVTTQDPKLEERLAPERGARLIKNYLTTMVLELQTLARACGKSHVRNLEPEDLAALTVEAAAMAQVPLAGTGWIPGKNTY
jgi:glutamate synthase domain-containing protein 2